MKHLFLDESGECSFTKASGYRHFLITILSVDTSEVKKIKNHLRRKTASFIKRGWDKSKEIKAFNLYKYKKFGEKAILDVISSLIKINSLEISYIIVNKEKIENLSFRNASYGISYNYFTGVLLSELIFDDEFYEVSLIFDKRNKESHQNKYFKEYLETKIFGKSLEKEINVKFGLAGYDSKDVYGLKAVDFFSWSIFRKFEHSDNRFFNLISKKLKRKREWYIE
ncbi:hypothetical protein ES702_02116 [subsurface metagenome]